MLAPLYYSYGGRTAVKLAATPLKQIVEEAHDARQRGDHAEATNLFGIALEREPENRKLHRSLLAAGVQRYGGLLEEMMRRPVGRMREEARQAFACGKPVEAGRIFEMLHYREPKNPDHLRCLAECYLQDGARSHAIWCLEKAQGLRPGTKDIARRLREIRRPWWKRLFRKEKPFLAIG
jgi:hypothetical protein